MDTLRQLCSAANVNVANTITFFRKYGVAELLDEDGERVTRDNGTGEIVATGFLNWHMPLIRYKTGDIGVYTSEKCGCGRNYPLLKEVEGRNLDYLVTRDGNLIPFNHGVDIKEASYSVIRQIQFEQEQQGELLIRVERGRASDRDVLDYVVTTFNRKLGQFFNIQVELVDEIPLTPSGKHRYLIQRIKIDL